MKQIKNKLKWNETVEAHIGTVKNRFIFNFYIFSFACISNQCSKGKQREQIEKTKVELT